jgi:DMSO/TMAO reductase YedYZ molybdopterin-dependent catalytic subunit
LDGHRAVGRAFNENVDRAREAQAIREGDRVLLFGPSLFSPTYYETQTMDNALKPECMLALEMKGEPLPAIHGAPVRLRVGNQLGYKMIKWIERIEFVESEKQLGKGEGGSNEDDEYFDLLPNI